MWLLCHVPRIHTVFFGNGGYVGKICGYIPNGGSTSLVCSLSTEEYWIYKHGDVPYILLADRGETGWLRDTRNV